MQPSIGSTEIAVAELETLLEQARQEPLRDDGYVKLRNAIRTLGLVSELLEKQETTLAELRELLVPGFDREDRQGARASRHGRRREETNGGAEETASWARAQCSGCLRRGAPDPGWA